MKTIVLQLLCMAALLYSPLCAGAHAGAEIPADEGLVSNCRLLDAVLVKPGGTLHIGGTGFAKGDVIVLVGCGGQERVLLVPKTEKDGVSVKLPSGLEGGSYVVAVDRGTAEQRLGMTEIVLADGDVKPVKVIAHRGNWIEQGSAQNSRASLTWSLKKGFFGSEIDVYLTADGHLLVNHDSVHDGLKVEDTTEGQFRNFRLKNGETMPQLFELLDIMRQQKAATRLIIEVKTHSTKERNERAVDEIMKLVEHYGLKSRVEYISFNMDACRRVVHNDGKAQVAYLNGDLSPRELSDMGITGIDYHIGAMRKHPEWYREARELGMTVNVWTVNSAADMIECIRSGADYVTTDQPDLLTGINHMIR